MFVVIVRLPEIFSLKGALLIVCYIWYITFIESYYFLCVEKNIEQIYRNICLLIRKLVLIAFLSVQNILVYNYGLK